MKTALITGSTDGIGKATALELAKRGYQIHVLGLGEAMGSEVLEQLNRINPKGEHEFFHIDLSTLESNNRFLDDYLSRYVQLDLLILNANAMFKKPVLSKDGIDMGFEIGYISRYLFSVRLDGLLSATKDSRVLHIGGATLIKPILLDKLDKPDYKGSDTTYMGFMANNLFVHFANKKGRTKVPYEYMEPGIVNTNTVKSQNFMVRLISKMMGMIEPEESGARIVEYIVTSKPVPGNFYKLGVKKSPKKAILEGEETYRKLMNYTEQFTDRKYGDLE